MVACYGEHRTLVCDKSHAATWAWSHRRWFFLGQKDRESKYSLKLALYYSELGTVILQLP